MPKDDDSYDNGLTGLRSTNVSNIFQEDLKTLRSVKKLRLVLDLDETLIHTLKVEKEVPAKYECGVSIFGDSMEYMWETKPSQKVEYWNGKKSNKTHKNNHYKLKMGNTTYHFNVRPNLLKFLQSCTEHYDVIVYTHGTVKYARNILKVIDCCKYISGVFGRKHENEKRKPKDLNRVLSSNQISVIIDDKESVWVRKDRPNLFSVTPYVGNDEDNELFNVAKFLFHVKQFYFRYKMKDIRHVLNHFRKHLSK